MKADFRSGSQWLCAVFLGSAVIWGNAQADENPVVSTASASGQIWVSTSAAASQLNGVARTSSQLNGVARTSSQLNGVARTSSPDRPANRVSKIGVRILKIDVVGNRNVRRGTVLDAVKTRMNDSYDNDKVQSDVKAIYELGNFEDVSADVTDAPGGVIVTYIVREKPVVKRINFVGNKHLTSGDLLTDLKLKENYPIDTVKLKTDTEKIISRYQDEGFEGVDVKPSVTVDAANRAVILFDVTEGKHVRVGDIDFRGVTAFPVKKLFRVMKTRRNKAFKPGVLTKDVNAIIRYYKNRGYPNAKITDLKPAIDKENLVVTISVTIDEGDWMKFGRTTFAGNLIFPSEKLLSTVRYKPGLPYSQDKMDATRRALEDMYGSLGYIQATVKPNLLMYKTRQTADIQFEITAGRVVFVNKIYLVGLTRTKDYVLRREIRLKEGAPFNSVAARQSVDRLNNLGFLDKVDMDVQHATLPDQADVVYTVVDGRPGRLSLSGGYYSGGDGFVGSVGYENLNFLGRGETTRLQWDYGTRVNSVSAGWSEPWIFGKPIGFSATVYNTIRLQQLGTISDAYYTQDRGLTLTLAPRFSNIYTVSFGYSFVDQLRYDVAADTPTRQAVLAPDCADNPSCGEFHADYSVFTEQVIRDTRDYYLDPSHGTRSSVALNEGIPFPGYSVQFVKPTWQESWYDEVLGPVVFALHGAFAAIEPSGGATTTDIQGQLFHLGGVDSVRGYSLGAVGVSGQSGNPGAKVENFYNAELRFPLVSDEYGRAFLQGVFFYDVGGDWDNFREMSPRIGSGPFDFQSGLGAGLRIKIKSFPIRLETGIPLNPAPGEAHAQFYFSIGNMFE